VPQPVRLKADTPDERPLGFPVRMKADTNGEPAVVSGFRLTAANAADAAHALLAAARRDVRLVVIDGRPLVGDPDLGAIFTARRVTPRAITVDDAPKLAESGLARRIAGCPIREPGVFST
jgi:hypothetical protein